MLSTPSRPSSRNGFASTSSTVGRTVSSKSFPAHSVSLPPTPTSSASAAGTPTQGPGQGHGLRSQLRHLLPRHTLFHARVTVHDVSSVPLVRGEFAVRWRFRHVQGSGGLLAKMRARGAGASSVNLHAGVSPGGSASAVWKGKGREHEHDHAQGDGEDGGNSLRVPASPGIVINVIDASPDERAGAGEFGLADDGSADGHSVDGHHQRSEEGHSPYLVAHGAPASRSSASLVGTPGGGAADSARGTTPWVRLTEHSVLWEHPVEVVLQMGVQRETGVLQASALTLEIMQRVVPGDPDAPRNPRLGAVYLNLAEYVDKGVVTRKYLLRESKTNALLKVSIELTHAGGEKTYTAPALQRGEVMAGVSDLLLAHHARFKSEIPRTTALGLGLGVGTPPPPTRSLPTLGTAAGSAASVRGASASRVSLGGASGSSIYMDAGSEADASASLSSDPESYPHSYPHSHAHAELYTPAALVPLSVRALIADGAPHQTANIIEAIFNPVPVAQADAAAGPFTYFDPHAVPLSPLPPPPRFSAMGMVRRDSDSASGTGSASGTLDTGSSERSHGEEHEHEGMDGSVHSSVDSGSDRAGAGTGTGGRRRWWARRHRSRERQHGEHEREETALGRPPLVSAETGSEGFIRVHVAAASEPDLAAGRSGAAAGTLRTGDVRPPRVDARPAGVRVASGRA